MEHVTLGPANNLGTVEHRTCARLAVSSLISVKLGEGNGGIALNISEGGLALSAANSLLDERIPELSIQLPGSRDWIGTTGQITWRSNSNKKCGVRFVGIGEDARRRIREWIAVETSSAGPTPEPESNTAFQNVEPESTAPAPGDAVVSMGKEDKDATKAAPAAEVGGQSALQDTQPESESVVATDPTVFRKEKDENKVVADRQGIVKLDPANNLGTVEHRAYARLAISRLAVCSLIFVKLGQGNGGIALNIGEGGLALSAANSLLDERIPELLIQLPGLRDWVRTAGQIIWRSNKKCGVRFFGMGEDTRRQIREWIAAETSSTSPIPKPESKCTSERVEPEGTALSPGDTVVSMGKENKHVTTAAPAAEIGGHSALQETQPESESAVATDATDFTKEKKDEDKVVADRRIPPTRIFPVNPYCAEAVLDRRFYPRKRINPLGYVQLGGENGGIALNVSEGGLSIIAVNVLLGDDLPSIRIQFPDKTRWVDVKGKIVWRSESKKEAGVRFVDLPEQARLQLTNWLSSPAPAIAVEPQTELIRRREKTELPLTAVSAPELSTMGPIPGSSSTDKAPEKVPESSPPPVVKVFSDVSSLPAAHRRVESRARKQTVKRQRRVVRGRIKGGGRWRNAGVLFRALTATVALLVFVDWAPLIRESLYSRPQGTKRMVEVVTPKQALGTQVTKVAPQPPPPNVATASQPQRPEARQEPNGKPTLPKNNAVAGMPTITWKHLADRVRSTQRPLAATAANSPVSSLRKSPGPNQGKTASSAAPVSVVNPTLPVEQARVVSAPPAASAAKEPVFSLWESLGLNKANTVSSAPPVSVTKPALPTQQPRVTSPPPAATAAQAVIRILRGSLGLHKSNTEPSAPPVPVINPTFPAPRPRVTSPPPALWPQEEARLAPSFIPVVSPPRNAEAKASEKNSTKNGGEGPSLPKSTEPALRTNGTVAITTDPYPSIRFSGEPKTKKSRAGTSLRLGQLVSRVEPAYPDEAMQKGVQGTVKIHVIVSPEGSIKRLVSVDGPPLLVQAAVRAVQQWRYSQTLLAGQPVETEDNIAVTFGPSAGINR